MAIPPQQLEEIRDRNNIVEVISEYLNLKRDGANYKAVKFQDCFDEERFITLEA